MNNEKNEFLGIAAHDLRRPLTAKPTAGEPSIGLGLSIVKKLAEAMNGRVWCESELGQGATFILELPAASP